MVITARHIDYYIDVIQDDPRKPFIIFLHGFMGSGEAFKFLIPHVKPFGNPVTVDLLGHGKTNRAASAERFSVENQIEDLNQIINKVTTAPPFLYGYSMGGRLALRYALLHSTRIAGLILESTNYGLDDEADIQQRLQTDKNRAKSIETNFQSFLDEWQQLPIFQTTHSLSTDKAARYEKIQRSQQPKQMALSLRGFGTAAMPSVKADLSELQRKVLLLAGQDDTKYLEITEQMDALLPDSERLVIKKAGHRVHLNQPELVAKALKPFIINV